VTIEPGERVLVPTGVALALPPGHAGFVHPRSGLAARHGISIVNAPGTVDEGYRGEILINLVNLDPREPFTVRRGDRIAQLVVQRVARARFVAVDSLDETSRGDTGHGSTGGFGAGGGGSPIEGQTPPAL
jgi:dUTP pyrophosphatase